MHMYPIEEIPFYKVILEDTFWNIRLETNRLVTLPEVFEKCEREGRIENFRRAADHSRGPYLGKMPFEDTDLYKAIEGASYSLIQHYDAKLDKYLDSLIEIIAAAQEPDGYLYTNRTIDPRQVHVFSGKNRWSSLVQSHELYNAGHLYEAANGHFLATGKRSLLNIALKNADLVCSVFGPEGKSDIPGHEIIEMGLVKLYRLTHKESYLATARFFIDQRGNHRDRSRYEYAGNPEYSQDHLPFLQQHTATGHAVRAMYLYCGVTDVSCFRDPDHSYCKALETIWHNMVDRRIYLTGGIGSRHTGEAFGEDYELPSATAYNETCAAIGSIFWNHRMFLASGESKYYDVLEQTLYNGLLSGISLSGDRFFYPNPLESDGLYAFNQGTTTRAPWFDVSCCPTNLSRFFPSLPGYIASVQEPTLVGETGMPSDDTSAPTRTRVYIELYVQSSFIVETQESPVQISLKTEYPWDGSILLTITPTQQESLYLDLYLRIPGWARGTILGSNLYSARPISGKMSSNKALSSSRDSFDGETISDKDIMLDSLDDLQVLVNDEPFSFTTDSGPDSGHIVISRTWHVSDSVSFHIPMPILQISCRDEVADLRGLSALQRGPLVYCIEQIDCEIPLSELSLQDFVEAQLVTGQVLESESLGYHLAIQGVQASAIPYHLWSNRAISPMKVWIKG